jgi:hypothetical protein
MTMFQERRKAGMRKKGRYWRCLQSAIALAILIGIVAVAALAQEKKPNIVFIMGDDIGMWNIGAYHRGLMAGRTPNLDKIAKEGMLFTDYYAEASPHQGSSRNYQPRYGGSACPAGCKHHGTRKDGSGAAGGSRRWHGRFSWLSCPVRLPKSKV